MWRELHHAAKPVGSARSSATSMRASGRAKSFAGAAWAVAIADVSMSLDNVLAVAGAARDHPGILIVGLIFAVALMGIAANFIARYIERYHWIAYIGLAVILYVAVQDDLRGHVHPAVGVSTLVEPTSPRFAQRIELRHPASRTVRRPQPIHRPWR